MHKICSIKNTLYINSIFISFLLFCNNSYAFRSSLKLQYRPKITEDITLITEIDLRNVGFNNDYRHFDVGVNFPLKFLGDGWRNDLRLRASFTRSNDNTGWNLEKRSHTSLTKSIETKQYFNIPKIKWKFRGRYEYRIRDNGNDTPRVRFKISMEPDKKICNLNFFVADELFYDFDTNRLIRNRIDLGFNLPNYKKVKSSILYRIDSDINRGSNIEHLNSVVLTFRF